MKIILLLLLLLLLFNYGSSCIECVKNTIKEHFNKKHIKNHKKSHTHPNIHLPNRRYRLHRRDNNSYRGYYNDYLLPINNYYYGSSGIYSDEFPTYYDNLIILQTPKVLDKEVEVEVKVEAE